MSALPNVPSFVGRFVVPIDGPFHTFELSSDPTSVGSRDPRSVEFWTVVTPYTPTVRRTFMVVGTGQALPSDFLKVWGHAYVKDGEVVWHLVEVPSATPEGLR